MVLYDVLSLIGSSRVYELFLDGVIDILCILLVYWLIYLLFFSFKTDDEVYPSVPQQIQRILILFFILVALIVITETNILWVVVRLVIPMIVFIIYIFLPV